MDSKVSINNKWIRGALPAVLIHISIGSVYAFHVLVNHISEYIDKPQAKVQFAFSLAIFFLGMSAAFGGKIVEKDIHKSAKISMICFCSGLCIAGLAVYLKSLLLLYLGYGCIMGIGLGTGYITPVKTLMLWFKNNKGLATGIAVCAFGFASSIASLIMTYLLDRITLPKIFIALAIIYVIPMTIASLILKKPDWWHEDEIDSSDFKLMSMWKNKKFVLIWLIIFINISCGLALIATATPIMTELNGKLKVITFVSFIMGIFNGAGRLVFSAVSDKLKYRYNIYYVILGLSAITTIITYTTKSNIMVYITLCVISACYGAGFSCLPTLLSDIYGMDNISKIHGLSLTAWAMAGLVGNQISSFINIRTGSYIPVLVVLFGLYTFAVVVNTILRKNIKADITVKENINN